MASGTLFEKLREELNQAKKETPPLEPQEQSRLLEKSIVADQTHGFDHVSHNSHGDWGKHWAHGGYEEESEDLDSNSNNTVTP